MEKKETLTDFGNAGEKARFVRSMFDHISPRYDFMNRLMTFGQDMRWRKLAIEETNLPANGRLLDIACGTGDLARAGLIKNPALVVAADFSFNMLRLAVRKNHHHDIIRFVAADGLRMPFKTNSFDAVVTGFSMRNVVNVDRFLTEMTRVVRPGGKVVILEATPFHNSVLAPIYHFYFHRIIPVLGGLLAGAKKAYTYLPQSVDIFLTADELKNRMEGAGLKDVHYKLLNMSTVALHWGMVR